MVLIIALALLTAIVVIAVVYAIDVSQTSHEIRRNYPRIGRFRYVFETMGEFQRQYFLAMDREELPFNRAQCSWVYRSAKNVDSTIPFGSIRSMSETVAVLFVNYPFPHSRKSPHHLKR
tara:strand:- start:1274 stop:1630 length:357 start_codon:yes stop_codon:yes gene_type:complete